jgi:hypothetical protein
MNLILLWNEGKSFSFILFEKNEYFEVSWQKKDKHMHMYIDQNRYACLHIYSLKKVGASTTKTSKKNIHVVLQRLLINTIVISSNSYLDETLM